MNDADDVDVDQQIVAVVPQDRCEPVMLKDVLCWKVPLGTIRDVIRMCGMVADGRGVAVLKDDRKEDGQ